MSEMQARWDGSGEELGLGDYRPLSVTAILSFVTGLLCLGSIFIPGLSLFGFISLGLAVVTVFSHSQTPKSFVWLSHVGVFVAVTGILWSLTGRSFYQNHMVAAGEEKAQQWLQMLADGKVNEAICLRMDYWQRPLEGQDLNEYFSRTERAPTSAEFTPPPAEMKEIFLESQTVRNLIASGERTKFTLLPEKTRYDASQVGKVTLEVFFNADISLIDSLGQRRSTSAEISVIIYRIKFSTSVHWQVHRLVNHTAPDPLTPRMLQPLDGEELDEDDEAGSSE